MEQREGGEGNEGKSGAAEPVQSGCREKRKSCDLVESVSTGEPSRVGDLVTSQLDEVEDGSCTGMPDLAEVGTMDAVANDETEEELDMDVDSSSTSTEEEDQNDDSQDDPTIWNVPADPHDLIAPSEAGSSLASVLWRNEYGYMPSAMHLRYKLAAHRHMVNKFGLYAELQHHRGCVNALNFNPAGTLLISGSDDLKVGVWDWPRKKLRLSFSSGHFGNVFQTKFMPLSNDSLIVSAARDGSVRLAELSEAGVPTTKSLCRHAGSCHKIDVRADSQHHLLTCGEDAVVNYVDIRQSKGKKLVMVYDNDKSPSRLPLYSIMSNPLRPTEFVVSGVDKFVRVFDMRRLEKDDRSQPMLTLCPPALLSHSRSLTVSSAVYNFDGSEILASYNDFNIFLFRNCGWDEKAACVPLNEYQGHRNNQTVKGVNFYGFRSEYVVSGSDCGRVFFWDKKSARIVHYLDADEIGAVNVLEPHPRDAYFATSGLEHSCKVWAPMNEDPPDLEPLIAAIDKNSTDRKRELRLRRRTSDHDGRFFMMLMNHLTRRNRQQRDEAEAGGQAADDDTDDEGDEDGDEGANGGEGNPGPVRCVSS